MIGEMTLARPYALAAFEYAQDKKSLLAWEAFLVAAATVVENPAVQHLMSRPQIVASQLADFFCEVLQSILDENKRNFIFQLVENKRLPLLSEIAKLFKSYRQALEKVLSVQVSSAIELDQSMKEKLTKVLEKKLKQQVSLEYEINPNLLGGLIIRTEDRVIDGSVQGKLKRLLSTLTG